MSQLINFFIRCVQMCQEKEFVSDYTYLIDISHGQELKNRGGHKFGSLVCFFNKLDKWAYPTCI